MTEILQLTQPELLTITKASLEGFSAKRDNLVEILDSEGLTEQERCKIAEDVSRLDVAEELFQFLLGETPEEGNSCAKRFAILSNQKGVPIEQLREEAFNFFVGGACLFLEGEKDNG